MISDFFGNVFKDIGMKMIGKGAFGGDGGGSGGGGTKFVTPSFSDATMTIYSSSPSGDPQDIPINDYEVTLAMWNKRLFGDNSYTNITLPRLDV
mgnify:FL=1